MKDFFKIKDVIQVFVTILLLTMFGQMVFERIPYFAQMEEVGGVNFVIIYLIQTLIIMVPLLLVMEGKNIRIGDLGFVKASLKKIIGLAFLGYVAYFAVMIVITQIMWAYQVELPGLGEQESHIEFIGSESIAAIVVIVIITFLAPIIEEVFFRGFVFKTMLKEWPKWLAFVISAAIFAGLHFEFHIFVPLFILGLILNWMFFKSKSLYPGIAFHIINNSIALGLEYYIYLHPEVLEMVEGFMLF